MNDGVHAFRHAIDCRDIADVALDQFDAGILQRAFDVADGASFEIVENDDFLGLVMLQKKIDRGGADEPASTRHKYS